MSEPTSTRKALPPTVWALGFTSLFMDVSSELIHGLLPLFLVVNLGASAAVLGLVEGIAEAAAQIVKVFSGWLSDTLQRRKILAVAGYGLAALTKPLFPLASTVSLVAFARLTDRIGKGIRGAPRDALVADVTPPEQRGEAFGLRQSLDTLGATLGPLLAIGLMALFNDDIRAVLWFAVIPAVIAVLILVIFVREPGPRAGEERAKKRVPIKLNQLGGLGRLYWLIVGVGAVFTLARFSEAFLVIRAYGAGLPLALAPAVIAVMSLVYALTAYPAGRLQDRFGAKPLLLAGLVALVAADLLLVRGASLPGVFLAIGLWGLHLGLTQGVLSALVADAAPADVRGTAFGVFGLAVGVATLVASLIAGILWEAVSPEATFLAGAVFAGIALLGFLAPQPAPRS